MADQAVLQSKYLILKKKLDNLHYCLPLNLDSVPLVERLLNDLIKASEGYQKLNTQIEGIKDSLQKAEIISQPLKQENNKLVKENNQLHLELMRLKESIDLKENKWNTQLRSKEGEQRDLKFAFEQSEIKVKKVQKESLQSQLDTLFQKMYIISQEKGLSNLPPEYLNANIKSQFNLSQQYDKSSYQLSSPLQQQQYSETANVNQNGSQYQNEFRAWKQTLQQAEKQMEQLRQSLDEVKHENIVLNEKLQHSDLQVRNRENEIARLQAKMDVGSINLDKLAVDFQMSQQKEKMDLLNHQIDLLNKENQQMKQEIIPLRKELAPTEQIRIQNKKLNDTNKVLSEQLQKLNNKRSCKCSQKGGQQSPNKNEMIKKQEDQIREYQNQMESQQLMIQQLDDQIRVFQNQIESLQQENQTIKEEVQYLNNRNEIILSNNQEEDNIVKTQQEKSLLSQQVEKLTDQINQMKIREQQLCGTESRQQQLEGEVSALSAINIELKQQVQQLQQQAIADNSQLKSIAMPVSSGKEQTQYSAEVHRLTILKEAAESENQSLKQQVIDMQKQLELKHKEIYDYQENIQLSQAKLQNFQKSIEQLQQKDDMNSNAQESKKQVENSLLTIKQLETDLQQTRLQLQQEIKEKQVLLAEKKQIERNYQVPINENGAVTNTSHLEKIKQYQAQLDQQSQFLEIAKENERKYTYEKELQGYEIHKLQEALNGEQKKFSNQLKLYDDLSVEMRALKRDNDLLKADQAAMKKVTLNQSKVNSSEVIISDLREIIQKERQNNGHLQEEINQLEKQISHNKKELQDCKEQNRQLFNTNEHLNKVRDQLAKKIEGIQQNEQEVKQQQQQIKELKTQISEKSEQLLRCYAELDVAKRKATQKEKQLDEVQQQLDLRNKQVANQLLAAKEEEVQLNRKLQVKDKQVEDLIQELRKTTQESSTMKNQYQDIQKLSSLECSLDNMQRDRIQMKQIISDLQKELFTKEANFQNEKQRADELEEAFKKMEISWYNEKQIFIQQISRQREETLLHQHHHGSDRANQKLGFANENNLQEEVTSNEENIFVKEQLLNRLEEQEKEMQRLYDMQNSLKEENSQLRMSLYKQEIEKNNIERKFNLHQGLMANSALGTGGEDSQLSQLQQQQFNPPINLQEQEDNDNFKKSLQEASRSSFILKQKMQTLQQEYQQIVPEVKKNNAAKDDQ